MVENGSARVRQRRVFTPWPPMPGRRGQAKVKNPQYTFSSQGPIWHCRGVRNHDNDTGIVARGQHWSITRTHRVCSVMLSLLGPQCPVGAAKPMQNTRNSQLALQGSFGTAEGRETMTTTPESSLEVNTGPQRARTVYVVSSFHSFAPNAPSVSCILYKSYDADQ